MNINASLAGSGAISRQSIVEGSGLKIKAVTWNAGNKVAPFETLKQIAAVEEGLDADLVVLGLQEFPTDMRTMKELSRGSLWRNKERLNKLLAKIQKTIQIPEDVKASKQQAVDALRTFSSGLAAKMQQTFREHVERAGFYNDLLAETGSSSAGVKLSLEAEDIKATLNGVISGLTIQKRKNNFHALRQLQGALKSLTSQAEYPPRELANVLEPVHAWANEAHQTISDELDRHQHVLWSNTVAAKFVKMLKDLQSTRAVQEKLDRANAEGTKTFIEGSEHLERELAQEVNAIDDARSQKIIKDVGEVLGATQKLDTDLQAMSDMKIAPSIKSSIEMALSGMAKMHSGIKTWTHNLEVQLEELMQSPKFELSSEELEGPFFYERAEANTICSGVSHFDTGLFVYVNPMSEWTFTVDRLNGKSTCKRTKGWGCTIDNNKYNLRSFKIECGKVVNMLKLRASKDDKVMSICALNTHMSFDAGVTARSEDISTAMKEADAAGCDAVVFVGDFNSRMNCEPVGTPDFSPFPSEGAPFFAKSIPDMLKSCGNDRGDVSLKSPCVDYDELALCLQKSEVFCYESKKKSYKGTIMRTDMVSHGFREAGEPNFIATYKVAHGTQSAEDEMGMQKPHCVSAGDVPVCYMEHVEKDKNKPAWPDRILVKANPRTAGFFRTSSYDVVPGVEVESDHLPVKALLSIGGLNED